MKPFFESLGVDQAKLDEIGKLPEAEQGPAYAQLAETIKQGAYEVARQDPAFREQFKKEVFNDARKAAFGEVATKFSEATGLDKNVLMDPTKGAQAIAERIKTLAGDKEQLLATHKTQVDELMAKNLEWERKATEAEKRAVDTINGYRREAVVKDVYASFAPKLADEKFGPAARALIQTKLSAIEIAEDGAPMIAGAKIPNKSGTGHYAKVDDYVNDALAPELEPMLKKASGQGAGTGGVKPTTTPAQTSGGQNMDVIVPRVYQR
jgi:hypothetical protein